MRDTNQQNSKGSTQKFLTLLCVYQMRNDRVLGNAQHYTDSAL